MSMSGGSPVCSVISLLLFWSCHVTRALHKHISLKPVTTMSHVTVRWRSHRFWIQTLSEIHSDHTSTHYQCPILICASYQQQVLVLRQWGQNICCLHWHPILTDLSSLGAYHQGTTNITRVLPLHWFKDFQGLFYDNYTHPERRSSTLLVKFTCSHYFTQHKQRIFQNGPLPFEVSRDVPNIPFIFIFIRIEQL